LERPQGAKIKSPDKNAKALGKYFFPVDF